MMNGAIFKGKNFTDISQNIHSSRTHLNKVFTWGPPPCDYLVEALWEKNPSTQGIFREWLVAISRVDYNF